MPKPGAFLPPETDLQMSASWIDGLQDLEIWRIGDDAGRERMPPVLARARADVEVSVIVEVRLTIAPDPIPQNPRHVNVCGWPLEKDKRMSIAQELCAKSMLRIRSEPN